MNHKLNISRISQAIILWLIFVPIAVNAQLSKIVKDPFKDVAKFAAFIKEGDTTERSLLDLFGLYLNLMLRFIGVVFVVQVVHGGFLWMTASGNEEQVKKARDKIINGAIGAAIVFLAYIITAFILYIITAGAGIPAGFETTAP